MSENKKYSYFPGCTLKNKALELDAFARFSAEALGFELCEINEWQCCGGVYPMSSREVAAKLPSVRALADARDNNQDLVTLCAACYNVLKQTNNAVINDEFTAFKANTYLKADEIQYNGETKVLHFLEILRDVIGWDAVKAAVKNPLKGKKIGAYYGCLLLRPGNVMQFDDPENPQIIEDFIKAIGGEPVIYARRNECCGGYITMEDKNIANKKSGLILENAKEQGAELLVTACPLCLYNLKKNTDGHELPVVYFTELLAQALGVKKGDE